MRSLTCKSLALAALVTSASIFTSNSANAEGIFENFQLSYAPQEQDVKRSELFDKFDQGEEEHELNDAWLGMPVKSSEGKIVGTVAFAFLDEAGDVSELLIELGASDLSYAVYIDGKNAELSEIDISVSMTERQIAGLEREENNQFAMK